jgi:hypothetical protein
MKLKATRKARENHDPWNGFVTYSMRLMSGDRNDNRPAGEKLRICQFCGRAQPASASAASSSSAGVTLTAT